MGTAKQKNYKNIMAYKKPEDQYTRNYKELINHFNKGKFSNNLLLFIKDKSVFNEVVDIAGKKFIGKDFNTNHNTKLFYSDEHSIEDVINECSNLSFFSEKRIVIYRIIKKTGVRGISKDNKEAFLNYIKNPNSDTLLILHIPDDEFTFSNFEEFKPPNFEIHILSEISEGDILDWVREKFKGYEVEDDVILHLLQFLNPTFDEIISEIEKLRMYCYNTKKITKESVNLCVGVSKDFDETDFIEAVMTRNGTKAIEIYDNITMRDDVEIYLLVLLNSAFISICKLFDNKILNYQGFNLFKELKIWRNQDRMLAVYKNFKNEANELKIVKAFDYIYTADKALKTSVPDKRAIFTTLIKNLTAL